MHINILKNKSVLIYLITISIVIKLLILLIIGPQTFNDGKVYIEIGQIIANNNFLFPIHQNEGMPLTFYVYAIFSPLEQYLGIYAYALPNIILASLMIIVIFKITFLIFENIKIANISAIITTFYPFFNFYSISILSETICIFFLYLSFLYAISFIKDFKLRNLIFFNIFLALSALTRASIVPMFAFFLLLFVAILFVKNEKRYILKYIFVSIIAFYGTMSPWIIRNYTLTNEIITTTKNLEGDFAFYIGNNPLNKTGGGLGYDNDFDLSKYDNIKDRKKAGEIAFNDAINWIKNNPIDWLILEYRKFIRFFRLTIYAEAYQDWYYKLLSIFSYGVVLVLFIYGLFISKKNNWLLYSPMLLFSILLTGVHMVLFASVRYRLPIEPFMIIVASFALYKLILKASSEN